MPDSLSPQASKYLESVANWFAKAEVKPQNSEVFKCTDKGRFDILKPLLKELNLEKAGFTLWRLSGDILLRKMEGLDNLFFPLNVSEGGIEVGGKTLMRNNFLRLTEDQPLKGNVDFLLVVIPEKQT